MVERKGRGKRPGTILLSHLVTYKTRTGTFQNHPLKLSKFFYHNHSSVSGPSQRPLPNRNGTPQRTPGEIQIQKNTGEKRIESGPKTRSFTLPGVLANEQATFLAEFDGKNVTTIRPHSSRESLSADYESIWPTAVMVEF